jgi:hypothetical protein
MAGRHRGGSANQEKAEVYAIIEELKNQMAVLELVKSDVRIAGSRIMALQSQDHDVVIAGGALINNMPVMVDEIITGLRIHVSNLQNFARNFL